MMNMLLFSQKVRISSDAHNAVSPSPDMALVNLSLSLCLTRHASIQSCRLPA